LSKPGGQGNPCRFAQVNGGSAPETRALNEKKKAQELICTPLEIGSRLLVETGFSRVRL
jgi:hypothetical protein